MTGFPLSPDVIRLLLASARRQQPRLLADLEQLVRIESPSHNKAACDRARELVARGARLLGGVVRFHRRRTFSNSLQVAFRPKRRASAATKPLLLLGHLDTVWPEGTLDAMPFRITRERVSGPGVLDMKGGVAMAFAALRILRENDLLQRPIVLLLHGDEEIGSPASRPVTEQVARGCEAVYVLEPGQGMDGAYKTARKGVGQYRLQIAGVAAHSGVDYLSGHSAVLELSRQLLAVVGITDLRRGLTVNPGVIGGGTLSNVIAAEAWAEIDVRIAHSRDTARVERLLQRLRPVDQGCTLAVTGGINRPPMERTRAIAALFARAQSVAAQMGIALEEAATGGGSDGNFTAAIGVPTLDGMGAVGEGAHAPQESLLRRHLPPRTALLAAMCLGES